VNPREPECAQTRQKLRRSIAGGCRRSCRLIQLEVELGGAAEESLQRSKHLDGPGTKPRSAPDQTSVETSIAAVVMRMLLTEPGRPPRARFEIVPAVEMTVPFLVCSM